MSTKKKKKGEHFDGRDPAEIHTSRANRGKDCKHGDPKEGGGQVTCAYAKKLPKLTYQPKKGSGYSQVHHILCVGEVNGYHAKPRHAKETQIDEVYRPTPWCISHTTNLIRLPHKKFFLNLFIKSKQLQATQAPLLPCHDFNHNLYNAELKGQIKIKVWDQVGEIQGNGKCFNEEHALAQFTALQTYFRGELKKRGARPDGSPGIPKVLSTMKGSRAYTESDLGKHWWVPFSMAQTSEAKQFPIYDLYPTTEPDQRTIKRRKKLIHS